MCVIIYKPVGRGLNVHEMADCFLSNPHGAGFMFAKDGKVIIEKGFMTYRSFVKGLLQYFNKDTIKEVPMIVHFRYSTQAGITKCMTHPYPICDSYEEMKKLHNECSVALAHNGVLSKYSDFACTKNNDSMKFTKDFVYPLLMDPTIKNKVSLIANESLGSRIAILKGDGSVILTGFGWVRSRGRYYSRDYSFLPEHRKVIFDYGVQL